MSPSLSFMPTGSVCLRFQFRLAPRPIRRILCKTQDAPHPRYITSGRKLLREEAHPNGLANLKSDESFPSQSSYYGPSNISQENFRRLRLQLKDYLGMDVLGQPAEILVLRDRVQQASRKLGLIDDAMESVIPNDALSSSDLLDSIDAESGIIGADRVRDNIEKIRSSWISGLRNRLGIPTTSEYEIVARILHDGFTAKQLLNYMSEGGVSVTVDPLDLSNGLDTKLYTRSNWSPGTTPFPGDAKSRLRWLKADLTRLNLIGVKGKPFVSGVLPKKMPHKPVLVGKIIRQHWHVKTEEERESLGELDLWLQAEHLDLILNHSE